MRSYKYDRMGFTIVELLVVVVVIAILAAITIISFYGIAGSAGEAAIKSDLNQASKQLETNNVVDGSYPDDADGIIVGNTTYVQYSKVGDGYCVTVSHTERDIGVFHKVSSGPIEHGPCPGHSGASPGGQVAIGCPAGFIEVPGNSLFSQGDFCVMKYEAKDVGGIPTSQAAGLPWTSISQLDAINESREACNGCELISEAQWLTIAHNVVNVPSNWTGGLVGSGSLYRGHTDGDPSNTLVASADDNYGYSGTGNIEPSVQRRTLTLSNGEVIWDMAGNANEWSAGATAGGQPGQTGFEYAWRNWSVVGGSTLDPIPYPEHGTPEAISWNANHGIGRVFSSRSEPSLLSFRRGGGFGGGDNAGVFMLYINDPATHTALSLGFRAAVAL